MSSEIKRYKMFDERNYCGDVVSSELGASPDGEWCLYSEVEKRIEELESMEHPDSVWDRMNDKTERLLGLLLEINDYLKKGTSDTAIHQGSILHTKIMDALDREVTDEQ